MYRISKRLAGSYTVTGTAYDDDGHVVSLSGTPTAVVTDGAGTAVTVAGSVTLTGSGTMSLPITYAEITKLDAYTVTWTASGYGKWTTRFELVGGFLCEITDVRDQPGMDDEASYPTADLRTARGKAEEHIEKLASRAFVPRGARETIVVQGQPYGSVYDIMLGNMDVREVYSLKVDGTALTAGELAELVVYANGTVHWDTGWAVDSVIEIHYEYGMDEPPGAIVEGCARQTVRYTVKNSLGGRRSLESTDLGTMRLTYGTREGETGDADLDAAIADFGHRMVAVG